LQIAIIFKFRFQVFHTASPIPKIMHKACLFTLFAIAFLIYLPSDAQTLKRFDLIIDEILADPTPVIGLPNAEYVEIRNNSGRTVNLQGWKLKSATASSGTFPSYSLPADSFLIISSTGNSSLFASFGRVLGIASFPALGNTGTLLSLYSKDDAVIHFVNYNNTWFQNDVKSSGGWSLEMIDTRNPCSGGNNWKASINVKGGTPGTKNSIDGNNPDKIPPALLRAFATDSTTIDLTFSEPIDSTTASLTSNYTVSDGIGSPLSAGPAVTGFNSIRLTFGFGLLKNKVYTVTVNNVTDCSGNMIMGLNDTRVGLPATIDTSDIVINEILFNPKAASTDYVELFNRSNKIFNLKDLYIAGRSSQGSALNSLRQLSGENMLLFPSDFLVASENGAVVMQHYLAKNPDDFIDVAMPSLPDDAGVFVLLNAQGKIIDELNYSSKWHFALIDNEEGVALERIDYNKATQNKDNWASAASTVGFGTPTHQNSQFRVDITVPGEVTITPKTFSPDNDGFEDYTIINIKLPDPGYVANITIFDAAGRAVKDLSKNASMPALAAFRWDGLDDKFRKVPVGVYIVYTEVFNLDGRKKAFKNTVVVAAKW
jgi:hypothetical protein